MKSKTDQVSFNMDNKKMYELYANEELALLKIRLVKKSNLGIMQHEINYFFGDKPVKFNEIYYTCGLREPLKQLAVKIKNDWLLETKNRYDRISEIDI